MPVPSRPIQYRCTNCQWQATYFPKSDVLTPAPPCCPKCSQAITTHPASLIEQLHSVLSSALGQKENF